jgi:tripartite-type tricarboxylate transporter receptor subunit TctC
MSKAVRLLAGAVLAVALVEADAALSQDAVADFYRGRTVILQVGSEAGGGYDQVGRLVARHIGRYIPGQPSVIVQNVPGAGGLQLLNQLYGVAPKDGTVIGAGISGTPTGALLTPSIAKFDPRRFAWLGSAGTETLIVVVTDRAPVKTLDELTRKELVVGGTASGSASVDFPVVTNALLGTRFKVVSGYTGAGAVVKLAMPSGEVDGCAAYVWSALKTSYAKELAAGKIRVLAQWGTEKDPELPDVPLFPAGKTASDRALFDILYARQNYGRPYMAPPGVPPARIAALRAAFAAIFDDAAFRSDAERQKLDLNWVSAATLEALTERLMASPPDVVARVHALLGS